MERAGGVARFRVSCVRQFQEVSQLQPNSLQDELFNHGTNKICHPNGRSDREPDDGHIDQASNVLNIRFELVLTVGFVFRGFHAPHVCGIAEGKYGSNRMHGTPRQKVDIEFLLVHQEKALSTVNIGPGPIISLLGLRQINPTKGANDDCKPRTP